MPGPVPSRQPSSAPDDPRGAMHGGPGTDGEQAPGEPTQDTTMQDIATQDITTQDITTRERLVAATADWSRQLGRLVGPDPLLHYRELGDGTLDLTHSHPSGLAMLLAGRPCRLSALVREPAALADARRRARAVQSRTTALAEERGLDAGWLAVGLARWRPADGAAEPCAPVLLRSCRLRSRGAAGDDMDLDLGSQVLLNPALVTAMAPYGVHLDADVIAELTLREDGFDPRPALARVVETCRAVPGFTVESRYVVSTFVTVWDALMGDLDDAVRLGRHDVVAALAGDPVAAASVRSWPDDAALADASREVDAHLVLDADAAQEQAVRAVVAGSHLLLDAPPATGASQTIANLVAVLAASGRRTLLVAQKRASLDAVLSRLTDVGLRDLVLDLPDAGEDRRRVVRVLAQTLDRAGAVPHPEPDPAAARRDELRALLESHTDALHRPREPWGCSAYEAQLALAELTARRPAPRSKVRLGGDSLTRLRREQLDELAVELREAARRGIFHAGPGTDPWFGARLASGEEADEALERVTRLSSKDLPAARERLSALLTEVGMPPARTIGSWGQVLGLLSDVRATLEVFSSAVYDTSLADVVAATGSAAWRAEHGVRMGALRRRKIRRHARRLLRPGRPPADLHAALLAAADQRRRWQDLAGRGSVPRLPSGLAAAESQYASVRRDLEWLDERLQSTPAGADLLATDLDVLAARLELLAGRTATLALVPAAVGVRERMAGAGLAALFDDLADRDVPADDVASELELVWWTSFLQHVAETDQRYGRHDGDALRKAVHDFADADRAHLRAAAEEVRRAAAKRLVRTLDRHGDQASVVQAERARDRRWRPVRDLVRLAPDVLAAAHPCWAMSPLAVSTALPDDVRFDVVVVDGGSACGTAELLPALVRGRQVVVVGDPRQLPPRSSLLGADEATEDGVGVRSSLFDDLADLLPTVALREQHGVLDERVLSFANRTAYGGELVTLPAADPGAAVTLEVVDGMGTLVAGQDAVESTDAEVQRVVELVVEHARSRPDESLGVVTMTPAHASRVRTALRVELSRHPGAAAFVAADRPERFFVKDAGHVHADTRDAVILSVGFGRTPHGRVLHRFGRLGADGGERLLTAATTCSRRRLTVVAAFGADDLDQDRLTSPGARRLHELLVWAGEGGRDAAVHGSAAGRDLLLADLADRLRSDDLVVQERLGAAQPVDLAVRADGPAWLVAALGDGPRYARLPVRDRDRLRPDGLARRGWRVERIWSTDVFRDPAREVARVRASVAEAQRPVAAARSGAGGRVGSGSSTGAGVRWDAHVTASSLPEPASGRPHRSAADRSTAAAPWTSVAPQRRGERPRVPTGRPIGDYRDDELDAVVAWICSDTLLRTHDQLAALVRQQLGFVRRSAAVDAAVSAAIGRVVARGDVTTADARRPDDPVTGHDGPTGRRRSGSGVQAHDPHERWLLDQRPPHWD